MQPLDLTNGHLFDNEVFSNISEKRAEKKTARLEKKLEKKEAKGKDTTKLLGRIAKVNVKSGKVDADTAKTVFKVGLPKTGSSTTNPDDGTTPSDEELGTDELGTDEGGSTEEGAEEKFLFMPKTIGIIVTSVVGLGLLVGGFFLVKKMSK